MVFSDLDGTLIDHETYGWAPARPALAALAAIQAPLVLASSKTAAEIHGLRADMGAAQWPAIVENGAGVLAPHAAPEANAGEYAEIRAALADLPADLRRAFKGFGDVTPEEVAEMTGLPVPDALRAQDRCFSEPGLWLGTPEAQAAFLEALRAQGITAQQGGRFLTLSLGRNKVDQIRALARCYTPALTLALGDAPNDIAMIEEADFGVIIANPHRPALPPLPGEAEGTITRTTDTGPSGWNTAVLAHLDRLDLRN